MSTFKISRRAKKQYPVESIREMTPYQKGQMILSMDESLGGGRRLLVLEIWEIPGQLPGFLAAYEKLLAVAYNTAESATRGAVCWWMSHADDLIKYREATPWHILSSTNVQDDLLRKYPLAEDVPYLIAQKFDSCPGCDLRSIRRIDDRYASSVNDTRTLTVIYRWTDNDSKNENEILVEADVFEDQFPGLVHASRNFSGKSGGAIMAHTINWWVANSAELVARGRICRELGMSREETGAHLWRDLAPDAKTPTAAVCLPPLEATVPDNS